MRQLTSITSSPAQYWAMRSEHVSLAAAALSQVDDPARERIGEHVIADVSAYQRDGQIRISGLARCTAATKWGTRGHDQAVRTSRENG